MSMMKTEAEMFKITVNEEQMAILVQALTDYAIKLGRISDKETQNLCEEVRLMVDIAEEQVEYGTGGWFVNDFDWTHPDWRHFDWSDPNFKKPTR